MAVSIRVSVPCVFVSAVLSVTSGIVSLPGVPPSLDERLVIGTILNRGSVERRYFTEHYHVTISGTGLISLGLRGHVLQMINLSLFREIKEFP